MKRFFVGDFSMDFYKYSIMDEGAFAPFSSTLEGTGAEIDGSMIMVECDNGAAKMLAESLVEYDIISPLLENDNTVQQGAGDGTNQKGTPGKQKAAVAGKSATRKRAAKVAAKDPKKVAATGDPKDVVAEDTKGQDAQGNDDTAEDPNKQEVYKNIIEKIDSLGLNDSMKRLIEMKVVKLIDAKAAKDKTVYSKLAENPMSAGKIVIGVIQKTNPKLFEKLKEKGVLNEKGQNTVSVAQKSELGQAMGKILGQIEVPDAFNVEVDDSDWENALITSCGYPMINLTSPLVRDMLRAPDPSQQKRAYKAFKKQLGADPDVAKALAIGFKGNLGVGGKQEDAKTDMNAKIGKTESVGTEGEVLVEGPLSAIKNVFLNPVEVLRSIAQNKGTACHRNNLVVMYDDIDGKSGEGNDLVKVVPLGVSSGVLVDLNKSVQVPMSHLAAFYSVVDPKVSFKSYAKAMAEVNKKNENAHTSVEGKARMVGKKLLSKIPLLGKGAAADLKAQDNNELMTAMGELAEYIQSNGHPPFYLLKPKSNPKEVDHWSDEKAANGYQMIIMNQNGHKAGIILKKGVAEALFKVG